MTLKPGSLPSIFAWTVSPRKRKSPTKRQRPSTSTTTTVDEHPATSDEVFHEKTSEELLSEVKADNEKLREQIRELENQVNELQIDKDG